MSNNISNSQIYLERMSKPLQEKLKITRYISDSTKTVLDVGCADGTVTIAMADMFPNTQFLGIDLSQDFIDIAQKKAGDRKNLKFEKVYLRDLLARDEKYDVVTFCSVLHEFFSYGEGISTIVKALADTHEILKAEGRIIIRDMILPEYSHQSDLLLSQILAKVTSKIDSKIISDFEKYYGKIEKLDQMNHLLLKYMYPENWDREVQENYTPVSFEKYQTILNLLGMKIQFTESYKIPYLREKWQNDFGFTEDEMSLFKTTGFIVAQKG